ncbi:MAG: hypothetical protein HKN23_22090, partial [Verrucomicrobiales bacterium]|nr:hypothetical protein [Verrucomicrobiales bacterium]
NGISTLGNLLAESAGCKIHRETLVTGINRGPGGRWQIDPDSRDGVGEEFDDVVLALPAPQAAELLPAEPPELAGLKAALSATRFQSQWSFMIGYGRADDVWSDEERYALVNPDREHPIAWLSHENAKPDRISSEFTVVMAQMQPDWTLKNYDVPADELIEKVNCEVMQLLDKSATPIWHDAQRWRFSLPTGILDANAARTAESTGIHIAGDSTTGKGRVSLALQSGLDLAGRLIDA